MIYLWLTAVPIIVCGIAYVFLHRRITLTELTIQVVVTLLIGLLCGVVVYHQNVDDLETLNGVTTGKDTRRVSCQHSYPCHPHPCMCSTSKSGFQSCSTCWDTCYRHFYDVDWRILTSLGPIKVHRVDDQGLQTPRRWEVATPGEPVAMTSQYENPIKAAPGTLFRHQGLVERYAARLFAYPQGIYDYHYMDRVLTRVQGVNTPELQRAFSNMNAGLQSKKANAIMVIVSDMPREYAQALEQRWIGGKKNDAILVVSISSDRSLQWAHVISWTSHEMFKVVLRKHIEEMQQFDPMKATRIMEQDIVSMFEHRSMHDFEYLKASITPSTTQWMISLLLNIAASIGLLIFMSRDDVHITLSRVNSRNRRWY